MTKVGRPTKYTEELIKKSKEYLNVYKDLDELFPTLDGLALYLEISSETVQAWCKDEDKKDFSVTVKKILLTQKVVLQNRGLDKGPRGFNTKIAQLLLGANHNVIEKTQTELTGNLQTDTTVAINFTPVGNKDLYETD